MKGLFETFCAVLRAIWIGGNLSRFVAVGGLSQWFACKIPLDHLQNISGSVFFVINSSWATSALFNIHVFIVYVYICFSKTKQVSGMHLTGLRMTLARPHAAFKIFY